MYTYLLLDWEGHFFSAQNLVFLKYLLVQLVFEIAFGVSSWQDSKVYDIGFVNRI